MYVYVDMNCQQIRKISPKKNLTEVKIFQKGLGCAPFLETPCSVNLRLNQNSSSLSNTEVAWTVLLQFQFLVVFKAFFIPVCAVFYFRRTLLRYVTFVLCQRIAVCLLSLSSVCDGRASYCEGWTFHQCFSTRLPVCIWRRWRQKLWPLSDASS